MSLRTTLSAAIAAVLSLASAQAHAAFMLIDGFGNNVMAGATRTVTTYPLPQTSTTSNGATFSESGGRAAITLGGNGNTAGALELHYSFASSVDFTSGGTNTQFYLVNNKISRPNRPNTSDTALSVTIDATDAAGVTGTYNTGIGHVEEGQHIVLNFNCPVNSTSCFSPQPNFTQIRAVNVRLAFPTNYQPSSDITELVMDSIYTTPTGAVFPPEFTGGGTSATFREGVAGNPVQFTIDAAPEPEVTMSGTLPAGITFNSTTATLSGTPNTGTAGQYPLVITATNDVGQVNRNFTLNVEGPPRITSTASTLFRETVANSFTVTAEGYPQATFSLTSGTLPPGVSLSAAGVLSGMPTDADRRYDVTITASNGIEPSASQSFVLTVNRAPRVSEFSRTIDEDTTLTFATADFVITEPDGQPYSIRIDSLPANGSLRLNGSLVTVGQQIPSGSLGGLTFRPSADWHGSTSFQWSATDATLWSPEVAAGITVSPVNDAPVIQQGVSGSLTTNEDTIAALSLTASDADNDALAWAITIPASNGVASVAAGGVVYSPNANFHGSDSFVVQVADGNGGNDSYSVNVTVTPVNDLPTINGDTSLTLAEDGTVGIALAASDADGDALSWSIVAMPANGTAIIDGSGASRTVGYTPSANYHGSDSLTVQVDDGHGGSANHTINVTVTPVNDPPIISGTPGQPIEGTAYFFQPTASDADGDTLTFRIDNKPSWANFDSTTGSLSGTPLAAGADPAGIRIIVDDGTASAELPFSLTVLRDVDGDGIDDASDPDADGDGIDNDYELAHGLDPLDPSDADSDLDGDGLTALEEYLAGKDPTEDDNPPQLTVPADVVVESTGLFTLVDLGIATATDALDGEVTVTNDAPARLAPGAHTVTWQAIDTSGNRATATQQVHVIPRVSFGPNPVSAEGAAATLKLLLNGPAATYPVELPYTVGGTTASDGSDHDLSDGVVIIESGTEATLTINLVDDGIGEGAEQLVVTLGTPANAVPGARTVQTVTVLEGNLAPAVRLRAVQSGVPTRIITADAGPVRITATVDDPNPDDIHSHDWSASDNALVDSDSDPTSFEIDPTTLTAGNYTVRLTVSDGSLQGKAELTLALRASAPLLGTDDSDGDGIDDVSEGYGDTDDDGVPNYLDAVIAGNVLQGKTGTSSDSLLETEPGLTLALGTNAFRAGHGQAIVTTADLDDGSGAPVPADTLANVGGLFDFTIRGLAIGEQVRVVLPLQADIPTDAVYRKLMPTGWQDFVEDGYNRIESAAGTAGHCPPPGDAAYGDGLAPGHRCVQLTLQDGGPNDADLTPNGTVEDPGGVAQRVPAEDSDVQDPDAERPRSRFGGGAVSAPMLLMLSLLLLTGRRRIKLRS